MHSDITALDACDLSTALHRRTLSCREAMQAYLARIEALNPRVNALVALLPHDSLLAQADERDAMLARGHDMGWMHGFPMAIKELSPVAGLPLSMGSPLLARQVAPHDSLVVARMKAAGGIVIGKTNVPEFGLGSHTYNPVFGATRNAYDPSRSAGGSSGGAAVSLALQLQPVADGSDMMGSLRNPAAWANVFGLRPSQGRVPYNPHAGDAYVAQLGTEGPMGRTVRDVAMLLSVQAGRDARQPLSVARKWRSLRRVAGPQGAGPAHRLARIVERPPALRARHPGLVRRRLEAFRSPGRRGRAAVAGLSARRGLADLADVAALPGGRHAGTLWCRTRRNTPSSSRKRSGSTTRARA